jgi:hypothetical protein
MKNILYILSIIILFGCSKQQNSFAIVVDSKSLTKAKNELEAYKKAIENDGLKVYIIEDKTYNPEDIKKKLKNLYIHNNLEGCVLIGDIPIPMIRDAQHLTSAFKMDQIRFPFYRSSIPSDRFYDDFDLDFNFLKQDTAQERKSYFYYSLKYNSNQTLKQDIYSARIRPFNDENRYESLKQYLLKAVEAHKNPEKVDNILFFAGHGYNSESMVARIDEKQALIQQFPQTLKNNNEIRFLDHNMKEFIKFDLLKELRKRDLDIALLHHHGGPTAQYLSGLQNVSDAPRSSKNMKYFFRSKLRTAKRRKRLNEAKEYYTKQYNVNSKWFEGYNDDKIIREDSIYNANLDIYIEDLENFESNARFILLDACYNGSFHRNKYQSGAYIFSKGKTIVCQGSSVNSIQDKWPNKMIGLLAKGLRIGHLSKYTNFLETHIIGDPTFHFKGDTELNTTIVSEKNNKNYWSKLLNDESTEIKCLALEKLYEIEKDNLSELLLNKYKKSASWTVRMQSLMLSSKIADENFIELLKLSINDSYELVRRLSAFYLGKSSHPDLLEVAINSILKIDTKRVNYYLKDAMSYYSYEKFEKLFLNQLKEDNTIIDKVQYKNLTIKDAKRKISSAEKAINEILNKELKEKKRIFSIRRIRNRNYTYKLDQLIKLLADKSTSLKIRNTIAEALGWYTYSHKKEFIINSLKNIKTENELLNNEIQKTILRLR